MPLPKKLNEEKRQQIVNAVVDFVERNQEQTKTIRNKWETAYDMFQHGSKFDNKQEWQSDFSINEYARSIRAAQGILSANLLHNPDWYELIPLNSRARELKAAITKVLDYYLEKGKFPQKARTLILMSLISMGSMKIGWKSRFIPNPRKILKKAREQRAEESRTTTVNVEAPINPNPLEGLSEADILEQLQRAGDELIAEAQSKKVRTTEEVVQDYLQVGGLDIEVVNPIYTYWDTSVDHMSESRRRAYDSWRPKWELLDAAKKGVYNLSAVKKLKPDGSAKETMKDKLRYKKANSLPNDDLIHLTTYFGPLVLENDNGVPEVVEPHFYCVIGGKSELLKAGTYPYWEPEENTHPIVDAAVHEVPFRPTGAGIGDNAIALQRTYDSNWQLINDQMRFGVAGATVVDFNKLVDKSSLAEGLAPGKIVEVRGEPKKVFEHVNLTSNIENQAKPVQEAVRLGIQKETGVNDLLVGQANLRSRTTAAETSTQAQGSENAMENLSIDLDHNFITPAVKKIFARVMQFGLSEIESNPELAARLSEAEKQQLLQLTEEDRFNVAQGYFGFKCKGFTDKADRFDEANKLNELLSLANNPNGVIAQALNAPEILKRVIQLMNIPEAEKFVNDGTEASRIAAENQLLMRDCQVEVKPEDNHEQHIASHMADPTMTEAKQMHIQQHQQVQAQIQQQQAAQQQLAQATPQQVQ